MRCGAECATPKTSRVLPELRRELVRVLLTQSLRTLNKARLKSSAFSHSQYAPSCTQYSAANNAIAALRDLLLIRRILCAPPRMSHCPHSHCWSRLLLGPLRP